MAAMEFTELSHYTLPSGQLTTWIPTTRCAGAHWSADERPLAFVHEEHCARSSTADSRYGSWLGSVFEISQPFDAAALGNALRAWMLRHEAFRTTVVDSFDNLGKKTFSRNTHSGELLDVQPFPARVMESDEINAEISEFFDRNLSPFRWPHCLVATVSTPEPASQDSFVLVFGADHSVMDAYSMVLAIGEIRRLYEYELHGTDPGLPAVGSHLDFSARDREIGNALGAEHRAVQTWGRFLAASDGRFPEFPLPHTTDRPSEVGARQSSLSRWILTPAQADAVAAHCRNAGHSMQSAILAAVALTNRELTGSNDLRYAMPMHTRHEFEYRSSVGWYVGIIPVEMNIEGAFTFSECLDAAGSAVDVAKDLAGIPYPRVARLLDNDAAPRFALSYLDVRYVPDADLWQQSRAHTLRSSADSTEEVYFWVVRSPSGLSVAARFPPNTAASASVDRMIDTFRALLIEASQTGSFPVADSVHVRVAS